MCQSCIILSHNVIYQGIIQGIEKRGQARVDEG
jgi:hypothetical protein